MARRRLIWKLYPTYLVIIVVCLVVVSSYAIRSIRRFHLSHVYKDLEARACLVRAHIGDSVASDRYDELDGVCKTLGKESFTRITVIQADGRVLADSEEDPQTMENHADRPEIKKAFTGRTGQRMRWSPTLETDFMYVAIPVRVGQNIPVVVRTSLPMATINASLTTIKRQVVLAGAGVAVLAAVICLIVSRRITSPLEEMGRGARQFAAGNLDHRLLVPTVAEMAALAEILNTMAQQLNDRIQQIERQGGQQRAMFSSMIEGVLAVDNEERILCMNEAAARHLGVGAEQVQGRPLVEVIRNVELIDFISRILSTENSVADEITLHGRQGERLLHFHGSMLTDSDGHHIGAVVVFHDITRLQRLENVRREFVANVSHELKTPITAIRGFVETLCDGAIDDPENREHFLTIIRAHVERLDAIIDDLLSLSQIERHTDRAEIDLRNVDVTEIAKAAIAACDARAREQSIVVELTGPERLEANINPRLLEQALVNLLDNAIKYSEPNSRVDVSVEQAEQDIVIHVKDCGCGIAHEHLPRIFERFYRVDKGRSRKLGGTGLGLAIVKHVAQAHGGSVTVESTVGQGSTFTIHLPVT